MRPYDPTKWEYAFGCDLDASYFLGAILGRDPHAVRSGNSVETTVPNDVAGPLWLVYTKWGYHGGYAAHPPQIVPIPIPQEVVDELAEWV